MQRRGPTTLVKLGGLAAAAAVTVVLAGCSGGRGNAGPSELETLTPASDAPVTVATIPAASPSPVPAPATAAAAVEGYLQAELTGDSASAFGLLSAADRRQVVDANAWRAAASQRPRLESFSITSATADAVVAEVAYVPAIDPVLGLVPAHATVTWRPVAEDGGFRLALAATEVAPRYPADATADDAALTWVQARQACAPDPDGSATSSLLLQPELTTSLCEQPGAYRAEPPAPLTSLTNPTPVLDAFGPAASTWARVVRLTGPNSLDVVIAPLGDDWKVIGVTTA